jgi:hypothetical protein
MVGIAVPIMVGIMVVIDVRNGVTGAIQEMVSQVRTGQPELLPAIEGGGDGPGA